MEEIVKLPYGLKYRDYQKGVVSFLREGGKRGVLMMHRRAGKDKVMFNLAVEQAIKKKASYAYVFPTYAQGKKVIWDSIDKNGKKFKDHIPPQAFAGENGTDLKYMLKNGSFIQVLGSENIDTLRGIAPHGIIFSEYAFHNPTVWDVMRPILRENGGWALFNSTPNGKNHFFDMYNMATDNEDWFCEKWTVDDTTDEFGNPIVTREDIEAERKEGMTEEMIQQEFYCSFDVGAIGSYYAREVEQARQDGRITKLPFNPDVPVDLYFDLGVNDNFTISFKQNDGQFYNFVNYYEDNGKTLEHYFYYIDEWFQRKGAKMGYIYLPHDSSQKSQAYLVSGTTILDKFKSKYPNKIEYIPNKVSINDGIQEVRKLFPRMRFDSETCVQLVRCLENYKKDYDDVKKVFRDQPRHDWASHGADNIRYFGVSDKKEMAKISYEYFNG